MTNNVYANQSDELEMSRQRVAARGVRFWRVRNEPYADDVRYVNGWYWRDELCEEPMGPFDSRADAVADCADLRGLDQAVLTQGGERT